VRKALIDKGRLSHNFSREEYGMAKVEIYTKAWCGFCARAKALLASKGISFEEYDITVGGPKRTEMLERANGGTTVPQIFIDGRHIGGSDDMAALDRQGKLDPLLGL
jgi:glutaredoxin 3